MLIVIAILLLAIGCVLRSREGGEMFLLLLQIMLASACAFIVLALCAIVLIFALTQ